VCIFLRQIKQEGYFKGELVILLNNLFYNTHQPSLFNSTCRSNDRFRRNAIAHRQFKNDFATTLHRYLDLCDPTQITLLCSPFSQKKLNEMRKENIENNNPMPTWRVDKKRPVGKHTLGNVMTKLSEMCDFDEPDGGGKQTKAAGRHLCITRCASEGVIQREINMHVRHSTAGISMQYQEVTLQTETMRLKALMPNTKKVN
jgi:hypothetical protein